MRPWLKLLVTSSFVLGLLLLPGCQKTRITFVQGTTPYDARALSALLDQTASPEIEKRPTGDAIELRSEALTELRSQSPAAKNAADLITRTFPAVEAVPLHVETGSFEDKAALILIEAAGGTDASLSSRRLWVLDDAGNVLLSLMR